MNKFSLTLLISGILSLAGCATVPDVPLQKKFWQDHKQKVNITTNKPDNAYLYQTGGEGLLDIAINDIVTNKFQTYLKTYPVQKITNVKWTFLKTLKENNINASIYNYPINITKLDKYSGDNKKFAVNNYMPFAAKIGNHKLLLVSVDAVGATRSYYGFIPLGAPKAICQLTGRLINVQNNKILWRHFSNVDLAVSGSWDQPPNYPNFTKTLNQAIANAQQDLLHSFVENAKKHRKK